VNEWFRIHGKSDGTCPVCGERVMIRGASAPNTETHFSHYPRSTCPTVLRKRDPFALLHDVHEDAAAAETLVRLARYHVRDLYMSCQGLVKGLSADEFALLLRTATARRVWYLKGLTYPLVPYVLVSLHDVFEPNSKGRSAPFFLVFPASLRRMDELWNARGVGAAHMWRVYPQTGDVEVIPISVDTPPGEFPYVATARTCLPEVGQ